MTLRPYQLETIDKARAAFANGSRRICLQLPTGAGKTAILTGIIARLAAGKSAWILAHRDTLLTQIGQHLDKWGVPFGIIAPGHSERRAVSVHVASIQTLARRIDKMRTIPDLIIIDEAHHIEASTYQRILDAIPDARVIGVTATPERMDGKGLDNTFDSLILGPSLEWLTEREYLVPVHYYAPPIDGLRKIGVRMGDYSADDVEQFLTERKIYGHAVDHYRKIADRKRCLVFCRTVQSCYKVADEFNAAGYHFRPLEGSMTTAERARILADFRDGRIHGLTTCELVTEGFDVPACEVVLMLRPTLSRALYYQMIGRCMRPAPDKKFGVVIDPVGNVAEHTATGNIYEQIEWRFSGRENNRRKSEEDADAVKGKFCGSCYLWMPASLTVCPACGAAKETKPRKDMQAIDGDLVRVDGSASIIPPTREDMAVYRERIDRAMRDHNIEEMLKISRELGYNAMWCYHQMTRHTHSVDVPLLYRIARAAGYKPGWAWMMSKKLKNC